MLIIDLGLFKLVRLFDKTMENVCSFDFIFECYPNRIFSLISVFYFYFSSFGHADIELLLLFASFPRRLLAKLKGCEGPNVGTPN